MTDKIKDLDFTLPDRLSFKPFYYRHGLNVPGFAAVQAFKRQL